jgi:DNA polymerase-4
MRRMGITCGAELKQIELSDLIKNFGKAGIYYYNIVRGCDSRSIEPHRERKSLGREITLQHDIDDREEMLEILRTLSEKVESLLRRHNLKGRTVTLKLKYADFSNVTRSQSFPMPVDDKATLLETVDELMEKTEAGSRKVRLLGITVSNFPEEEGKKGVPVQLELPF